MISIRHIITFVMNIVWTCAYYLPDWWHTPSYSKAHWNIHWLIWRVACDKRPFHSRTQCVIKGAWKGLLCVVFIEEYYITRNLGQNGVRIWNYVIEYFDPLSIIYFKVVFFIIVIIRCCQHYVCHWARWSILYLQRNKCDIEMGIQGRERKSSSKSLFATNFR